MSRRYYILKDGERLYRDTQDAIRKVAKALANATGSAVRVYEDTSKTGWGGTHKATVQRGGSVSFTRNPMMAGHDYRGERWKITGKNPRTGSFIHAYADSKTDATNEARVLRGAGYVSVSAMQIGKTKKMPQSKAAAMKAFKRNPAPKNNYFIFYRTKNGVWLLAHVFKSLPQAKIKMSNMKKRGEEAYMIKANGETTARAEMDRIAGY